MKIKLLSKIEKIEVKGTLEEVSRKFNKQPELILKQYDAIVGELKPTFKNRLSANLHDLNEKIQYIKVINELGINSYMDDPFEEIIGIAYNLMQQI